MSTETDPTIKAFNGSCHCGLIKYKLRLAFPPIPDPAAKSIRIYKCNCTTCQKMGLFHVRPIEPGADFVLLSPSEISEMGAYSCNNKIIQWYFCKECGVRPFALGGEWVRESVDLGAWEKGGDGEEKGERTMTEVFKAEKGEWKKMEDGKEVVRPFCYLSVNAVTLDGVDLKKWHEKGWIFYVDCLERTGQMRFKEPHDGGMY